MTDQGQGASLAFEDAEGLSYLISQKNTSSSQIPSLLSQFTEIRKERVHSIQHFSRVIAQPANYHKEEN